MIKRLFTLIAVLGAVFLGWWGFTSIGHHDCPLSVLSNPGETDVQGPVSQVRSIVTARKLSRETVISYDEHGRRLKADYLDSKGRVGSTANYRYAHEWIFIEEACPAYKIFTEYTYDHSKNEVIRQIHLLDTVQTRKKASPHGWRDWVRLLRHSPERGDLVEKTLTKIDCQGKPVEFEWYNSQTGKLENKAAYNYDSKGNLVSISGHDISRRDCVKSLFTYDQHGNQTKQTSIINGRTVFIDEFVYKYDSHGNWIERTTKSTHYVRGKPRVNEAITKRQITYR